MIKNISEWWEYGWFFFLISIFFFFSAMNVFYLSNKKEGEDSQETAGLSFSSDSAATGGTYFPEDSSLTLC